MKTVLEYLERSTNNCSDKIAVIDEDGKYTYKELTELSKKIGTKLTECFEPRNPVPVLMEKGKDTLATFFGAVYAGCFYVLLNPDLPKVRLEHIVNVLGANHIVTDKAHKEIALELISEDDVLYIEELKNTDINKKKLEEIRNNSLDLDPLYANFTSGSTGVPKGVLH